MTELLVAKYVGVICDLDGVVYRGATSVPGAVDTRMTAVLTIPKMAPADAAAEILDGFEAGEGEIYVGDMARGLGQGPAHDPKAVERQLASPG